MKKTDYLIFFLLVMLLIFWPNVWELVTGQKPGGNKPDKEAVEELAGDPRTQSVDVEEAEPSVVSAPLDEMETDDASAGTEVEDSIEAPGQPVTEEKVDDAVAEMLPPAQTIQLTNEVISLTLSSRGGSIIGFTLHDYREELDTESPDVSVAMQAYASLGYEGLSGVNADEEFSVVQSDNRRVQLTGRMKNGLRVVRTIELGDGYLLSVTDEFENDTVNAVELPVHSIRVGSIIPDTTQANSDSSARYMSPLGVDYQPVASKAIHLGKKITKRFKEEKSDGLMPPSITWSAAREPLDWAAVKNKYFAQVLLPKESEGSGVNLYAVRETAGTANMLTEVGASILFEEQVIGAGDSFFRDLEYYAGPKKFGILSKLSHNRDAVIGFDENTFLSFIVVPIAKILLRVLNFIHDYLPPFNYGVAIMLLTIIIRVLFWPITHKSTESMRKMSELQPQMQKLREKYKDNPQKQSQELMALYKENKVNPLGGCVPMFVQIPVFFGLFVILRIAIELRFAGFLWIDDLSAPERLIEFGFKIPLLGWDALNILPIFMALSMYFQQKMTPAAGDPQQQKIMRVMMPGMMLFFLYNFASGLALYWTTQNVLMIVQQALYRYRKDHGMLKKPAK